MDREQLAVNLLTFVPLMFKRLMKVHPHTAISRHQMELLFKIQQEDQKPMSFYSEKMMVPKSNLTVLTDKLIEEGLVERAFDPNDRRVVNLKITEKGQEVVTKHKQMVKRQVAEKLSALSDEDVTKLNCMLNEMKAIFEKLEN